METVTLEKFEEERRNHLTLQAKYLKLIDQIRDIEKIIKLILLDVPHD